MVNENNSFLVVTRNKTRKEVDEFIAWMDENSVQFTYAGRLRYWIEGEGDATMVKLFWGA